MITREEAQAWVDETKAAFTFHQCVETIIALYEQVNELEEVLDKAINDHCGCLGGLRAP